MAKPAEALALVIPAMPPRHKDITAMPINNNPVFKIDGIVILSACILFIKFAVINGIAHSIMASPVINIAVKIEGSLYCRMLWINFLP